MPRANLVMTPAAANAHATAAPSTGENVSSQGHGNGQGQVHEEHLVSALQAALHSLSGPGSTPNPDEQAVSVSPSPVLSRVPLPMVAYPSVRSEGHGPREKPHAPTLDISVANDQLCLRGTGVDVEPTLLSGNVVLNLTEPTSIKQVVLVFRGKARVPSTPHDPHVLNSSPSQYMVCSHEWTFLEGEKKHSHTLKAGRHLFPFELRLGGALPSSLATYANGGASISYKLRATAIRPGLAANLTASLPITLLRTFAPESLEYQQTLEIENTWPEKVMYSLMIPHKAWAAGDELTALLKFVPLAKGVRVLNVTTHLCETIKTLTRGSHLEKTRNVVTRKHEIVNRRAVSMEEQQQKRLHNALQRTLGDQGRRSTGSPGPSNYSGASSPGFAGTSAFVSGTSTPVNEGLALCRLGTHDSSGSGGSIASSGSGLGPSGSPFDVPRQGEDDTEESTEISTSIKMALPPSLTPSHSLDPIIVSYRIRWSVLLANLDGHTSELRCSLPIHILDYSLLDEARAATLATRRLLFGGVDATHAEEEIQLPSYPSHIRDRLAMDVTSFDVSGFTPFSVLDGQGSGTTTPAHEGVRPLADFPGFMQENGVAPFAFGIPLSRAQTQNVSAAAFLQDPSSTMRNTNVGPGGTPDSSSADSSRVNTRPNSRDEREGSGGGSWSPFSRGRIHSRANSRTNSRAPSPERAERERSHLMVQLSPTTTTPGVSRTDEVHIHASNAASRQLHGLFSVTMKPLTSISLGGFSAPWHSHSHSAALAAHFRDQHAHAHRAGNLNGITSLPRAHAGHGGMVNSASTGDLRALVASNATPERYSAPDTPNEGPPISTRSIDTSAVPDYFTAAHTSGDVPPLESLRGLPTYEDSEAQVHGLPNMQDLVANAPGGPDAGGGIGEAQRAFSDSDLVSLLARSHRVR